MINSLKELRETLSLEDLDKYYAESLNKNAEEIKDLLKEYNVDVSLECANECYEFCKRYVELKEEDLLNVAGGIMDPALPEHIRGLVMGAHAVLGKIQQFESPNVKIDVQICREILKRNIKKQTIDKEFRLDIQSAKTLLSRNRYSSAEIELALKYIEKVLERI